MQCYEFEVMRVWLAARLRAQGLEAPTSDAEMADLLAEAGLGAIEDVIRLTDARLAALVRHVPGVCTRAA